MTAETAARRYTCQDCRKTYRSFRSLEEWRKSHLAEVCTAHGVRKADVVSRPAPADGRPRQLEHVIALAAAGIAAILLVAVAVDASRTVLDAASAGAPPLRFLLAAVISGPCLYGAYRMARMALPLGAAGRPVPSQATAGTE